VNTSELPPLALTDHFLGYSLCPPSVKEWPKCLKCSAFLIGLPTFLALTRFSPLTIDIAKDYLSVALQVLAPATMAIASINYIPLSISQVEGVTAMATAAAPLSYLLQFFASASQSGLPSSKLTMPPPLSTMTAGAPLLHVVTGTFVPKPSISNTPNCWALSCNSSHVDGTPISGSHATRVQCSS